MGPGIRSTMRGDGPPRMAKGSQPGQVGNQAALTVESVPGVRLVIILRDAIASTPEVFHPLVPNFPTSLTSRIPHLAGQVRWVRRAPRAGFAH